MNDAQRRDLGRGNVWFLGVLGWLGRRAFGGFEGEGLKGSFVGLPVEGVMVLKACGVAGSIVILLELYVHDERKLILQE